MCMLQVCVQSLGKALYTDANFSSWDFFFAEKWHVSITWSSCAQISFGWTYNLMARVASACHLDYTADLDT